MGESVVDRPVVENKMSESVPSGGALEVSVSFGRFDNDSLSWEKWSSFTANKYLDEVEKCSTPGSVAQKKAYFEAHYKKIAARKAEQLDQEKPVESVAPSSNEPDHKDHVKNTSVADCEFGLSSKSRSTGVVEVGSNTAAVMNNVTSRKEEEEAAVTVDCLDLSIEEAKEELNYISTNPESNDREEGSEELSGSQAVLKSSDVIEATEVHEEVSQKRCQDIGEQPLKEDNEAKNIIANNNEGPKLFAQTMAQKMTPSKKEQTLVGAKKKGSVATKSSTSTKFSQISTPRLSKSTAVPALQSSGKKVNGSSLSKGKITSPGENRKATPTSLHMSLRLDPPNSGATFSTTRKSLIMEKMGDKDIVRRAFKTFQNSINGLRSSHDEIFSGTQQVSNKGHEQKVSATSIPQKENGGLKKSAEKINERGHPGNRSNPVSWGSYKGSGAERKYGDVVLPSIGTRSDARAEKQKEELEEKAIVRESERANFSCKAKVEKGAQMKNPPGLSLKATLSPAPNRTKVASRVPSEKEDKRTRIHHQSVAKR